MTRLNHTTTPIMDVDAITGMIAVMVVRTAIATGADTGRTYI